MHDGDTRQRLSRTMASIFKCAPDAIREDAQLHKFPRWDSLAHIQLMLALEKEFGVRVRDADIVRLISFEKLAVHFANTAVTPSIGR